MIEQLNNLARVWWDWMWPMFWQVGALIAVIGVIDLLFRRCLWPQVRYALWLLVVVKLILPPTFALPTGIVSRVQPWVEQTFKELVSSSESSSPAFVEESFSEENSLPYSGFETSALAEPFPDTHPVEPGGSIVSAGPTAAIENRAQFSWQTMLMAVWLAGVLAVALWSVGKFHRVICIARGEAGGGQLAASLLPALAGAARKLHLRRLPPIVVSPRVGSPAVIGPFRPMLLVPAQGAEHLSTREAEHIFLHELAHIKRGDLKVQALCLLIQICYWFNPFLWFVQCRLQHLREICCDTTVARILKDEVAQYRQTILGTARWLLTKPSDHAVGLLGLVENRSRLLARLSWLERMPQRHYRLRLAATLAIVLLTSASVLPMAQAGHGQTGVSPESNETAGLMAEEAAETRTDSPGESVEEPLLIRISDFGRWIRELQHMLAGKFIRMVTGLQDDKGMPTTVVYFDGAEDRPLVFHLEKKEDDQWCVDYFYIGSPQIEKQEIVASHPECPVEQRFVVPRLRTTSGSAGTLAADRNPVEAVNKQIDHVRELLMHRFTGAYRLSPPDKVMCGFVTLGARPGDAGSHLAFHLVRQGGEYRVDCVETTDSISGCLWTGIAPARQSAGVLDERVETRNVVACDDFDGKFGLDWDIVHTDPSHFSLTENPGSLTITTQDGHFKEGDTSYKNLFLIDTPVPQGEGFQVTTCLSGFRPSQAFNQAGLICWDDEDNYLEWVYQKMQRVEFAFAAGVEANGPTRYTYIPAGGPFEKLWLRVTKRGSSYQCASSTDGKSFTVHTVERWGDGTPNRIGLFAINGSLTHPPGVDASFDLFEAATVNGHAPSQAPVTQQTELSSSKSIIPQASLQIPNELEPCVERLRAIYDALKRYEKDKGSLPDWLSDLVPAYLSDEALIWPEDGPQSTPLSPDRNLPCSFGYQYSSSLPAPGGEMSYREFKDQERKIWGDVAPLVRYYIGQRCLNVSFDGRIYMSGTAWEREIQPPAGAPGLLILSEVSVPSSSGTAPGKKVPDPVAEGAKTLAFDDFEGKLSLKWDIVNPNPSNYSLTKKPGTLTITTKKGHFSKGNKNYENVFLLDVPAAAEQDFQITTCLASFPPIARWNEAGILCWDDEDNYVKLVYEWAGRPTFTVGHEVEGRDRYTYHPVPSKTERVWLRITKRGASYRCATSTDGESFATCGSATWKKDAPKRVGIFANNGSFWSGPVPDLDASFEFFEAAVAPPERVGAVGEAPAVSYEADLEAFFQEMDGTYPFFEFKGIRDDWKSKKKRLREEVKGCQSDERFLQIVTGAVLCLRDSHMWFRNTRVPPPQRPPKYCPGICFWPATNERVIIAHGREELDPHLKAGTVVTKIDGRDARQHLEERAKARWAEGGISGPQRARLFAYRIALTGAKKGEKHTVTILADAQEREIELTSDVEARGWAHFYNLPKGMTQVGRSCWYTTLPSGTAYVYLRRVDSSTGPGLKEAFSKYAGAKGWIIDLRGNGGGGYDQALHETLRQLPHPLAVLIDAGCTSAGETLARDFALHGNARLFGSKTAGSSSAKRIWTFPSGIASLSVPTRSRWGIDEKPIEFLGIEPHVKVEAVPEEVRRGLNSGILRAEEYLNEVGSAKAQ